ncbi:glycosyltransferase [Proteus mirabilis]|uniref:glycosyltransferase n=1 Tax=Proteus mirabilis TaxID=584 RepID=UPI0018C58825|nr:glycosyltransferase [Proteus mirabilis]MBG6001325.1 glycosyltransferase [Proteus mirabilis]
MKIAFIITSLGVGGAEIQVTNLADEYSSRGHEVLLISLTGNSIVKPIHPQVKVIDLMMKKNPYSFILNYIKTRRIIKEFQPTVVHSHMIHANIFSRFVRLSQRMQLLICTAHSNYEGSKIRNIFYRLTDRLCDLTTNVSQNAVESSIKKKAVPKNKIKVMYNGINTKKYCYNPKTRDNLRKLLKINKETPLLLSVGRLTPAKDYPNLLHAFSLLSLPFNISKLIIIGDGAERKKLQELAEKLDIHNRVIFLGTQNDINEWMSAADIFVLSSAWEGFGLVIAEAMSCERIVVATDAGGVKEVLSNNGFLVPIKDSNALSKAIEQALTLTEESKKSISTSAKNYISENFCISKIADKWLTLYSNLNLKK